MARIGFGSEDANAEVKALAEQIRRERGGLGEHRAVAFIEQRRAAPIRERKRLDDRQLTELTATIAAYNLVSRFLIALQVGH
jgi:alkylhydroperoxidase family enzyme